MSRTVKPFTKAQQQIVTGLEVKVANMAVDLVELEEKSADTIAQLAAGTVFAAEQADQRTRQLKDVTPKGDRIDVFISVSNELVLRATKQMPNGVTDVQVHFLDPHTAYALANDLEFYADESGQIID